MTSSSPGDELRLIISLCGRIEWLGAGSKLKSRGLVPSDFKWPARIEYAEWRVDGFDFLLRRCRPDGLMGPMRGWMDCDYWCLRRTKPYSPADQWLAQEPYRELGDVLFQSIVPGEPLWVRFSKQHEDERIEHLEARLMTQPRKGWRARR